MYKVNFYNFDFYVYYERTDVTNKETRPLVISFNGGPGTASVWMHLGYTGPKKLKTEADVEKDHLIKCSNVVASFKML